MNELKLIILRPEEEGKRSAEFFRGAGIEVVVAPATEIVDLDPIEFPLIPENISPNEIGAALFTSPRAVAACERGLTRTPEFDCIIQKIKSHTFPVGAVAERTASAIENHFGRPATLTAPVANQESLGEETLSALQNGRIPQNTHILFPCAKGAAHTLEEMLQSACATLIRSPIYESRSTPDLREKLEAFSLPSSSAVYGLYAPSQAKALYAALNAITIPEQESRLSLLCIGKTTGAAASRLWPGAEIAIAAETNDEAMLTAFRQMFSNRS